MLKNPTRIQSIQDLVPKSCGVIYDICCDHGQIGENFLGQKEVIFIDQVPTIMDKLSKRLKASYITDELTFQTITQDARCAKFKNKLSSCIIICGIGADLAMEIINNQLHNLKNDDFLLIGVHKNTLKMRAFLKNNSLKMKDERLVEENGKFYELLLIDKASSEEVSQLGTKLWNNFSEVHKEYLLQQIRYFTKKCEYNKSYQTVLDNYCQIAKKNGLILRS